MLLFLSSASAQISVQTVAGEVQSTSNYSLALPSSTAGNLILIGVTFNSTLSSISDSQGNSLTQVGNELTSPAGARSRIYFAKNIKGGPDTVTVNLSASSSYLLIYISEYSGVDKVTPIDAQAGASGSASAVSSGGGNTTASGDLIYGYCIGDIVCTAGSGFTTRSTYAGNLVEDMVVTAPGTYAATGSANSGWTMQMVALKPASGSSSPAPAPSSACDLAQPYGTPDSSDVQAAINMTLGVSPCTANIMGAGVCNVVVVQRVVNAALPGGACVTGSGGTVSHSVVLNWAASTTPSVTYNVYRSGTSGVYSAPLASSISTTSYTDNAVQSGQTYYYVVTAVNSGGESARSNESPAAIPVP
jgi:hypothetical protein